MVECCVFVLAADVQSLLLCVSDETKSWVSEDSRRSQGLCVTPATELIVTIPKKLHVGEKMYYCLTRPGKKKASLKPLTTVTEDNSFTFSIQLIQLPLGWSGTVTVVMKPSGMESNCLRLTVKSKPESSKSDGSCSTANRRGDGYDDSSEAVITTEVAVHPSASERVDDVCTSLAVRRSASLSSFATVSKPFDPILTSTLLQYSVVRIHIFKSRSWRWGKGAGWIG